MNEAAALLAHPTNWTFGWCLLFSGFVSGAILGMGFHKPEFLGGYGSFARRLARLGHIAQCALGIVNVVYGLSPIPVAGSTAATVAGIAFVAGGVLMPTVCFLSAWREPLRVLFPLPVVSLVVAVAATALGGFA